MGLKIHSIAEFPDNVTRSYYLYVLDYYNWDEPIGNALRSNFDRMASFASKNDAVIIQPVGESHFFSELLSWEAINGLNPEEVLPAIMITTIHPKYFMERDNQQTLGEPLPDDNIIFIQLKDTCKTPNDLFDMLEKIFLDIQEKKELKNFQISRKQKSGTDGAIVDSIILEPNFMGIGIDVKKLFSFFGIKKT